MDEIINRVKESSLIAMDLADFKPRLPLVGIDISEQLWQGLVLKEKDFRAWIKTNDWEQYKGKAVYIHCSSDAIIPTWAFMLIGSSLQDYTDDYIVGERLDLEKQLILDRIQSEPLDKYIDGRMIIKGCADISCPEYAMTALIRHLQPVAKSIMYGEPCSTVPVFKRKSSKK
ncbi:MAG: DUF2480 family protein [Crocinitomicaceae bacterium]|nr:DUF2480 family protein [Crocinitomicaceae bacterium]